MQTEALTSIRFHARQLADLPIPGVRSVATDMLAVIDREIKRPEPMRAPKMDLPAIPLDALLAEISRRVRAARKTKKLCGKCKSAQVRAKGLCLACYQRARRA